jgi:hypothetical protein
MSENPLSRIVASFRGHRAHPAQDVEHGSSEASATPSEPKHHVDHHGRPQIRPDDQLNLFRHLTGITSHPSMSHTHSHFGGGSGGGRAAPNLGIYNRVVHNEQEAKRGYKRFSWLINCCLGLQIVVAAALTAMGAAGASHSAVTVFGAINTVIAGLLTFLKGSGLPNRLKYYQAEWKRVREFIEQRERDFSRPGCDLDVYAVMDIVENMYASVKADLEATVPDRFAGIRGGIKNLHPADGGNGEVIPAASALPRIGAGGLDEKLKEAEAGFGGRVKDLVSDITHKSQMVTSAQGAARGLQQRMQTASDDATKGLREHAERAQHLGDGATQRLKDQVDRTHQLRDDATRDLGELTDRAQHLSDDAARGLQDQVDRAQRVSEAAKIIQGDASKALDEHVTQAQQVQGQAKAIQEDVIGGLGKTVESAQHAESNFLAKLRELRSEIGNRSHLAQEAMHFLQDAYHHDRHDTNEGGKRVADHHAEPGASS